MFQKLIQKLQDCLKKKNWHLSNLVQEKESQEYLAYNCLFNHKPAKFRLAKVTPTKIGQFVTLWKRDKQRVTTPHHLDDPYETYLIVTQTDKHLGIFVFPKELLAKYKYISTTDNDGKRGFRVYPTWDHPTNKQGKHTQKWQSQYFFDFS